MVGCGGGKWREREKEGGACHDEMWRSEAESGGGGGRGGEEALRGVCEWSGVVHACGSGYEVE